MDQTPASMTALIAVVPGPGLLFGLMLLAAIVGGHSARRVHVPRVIGYLLGGIVLRWILQVLLHPADGNDLDERLQAAVVPLRAINDLALGLILFSIGGVFQRSQLKTIGPRVARIGTLEIGLVILLVFLGCGALTLATQPEHGTGQNLTLALLLAIAAIATAPAATLFVLREYEAKGAATDTILGLVGLNNVVCIVVFHAVFLLLAAVGAVQAPGRLCDGLWLGLAMGTLGSVAVGILCGALLSMVHARLPLAETSLIFFAMFIMLGAGEKWLLEHVGLSFNFLLTALVIGAVYYNVAIDSQTLDTALRTVATPIFAGFFVMAGYDLHLGELVHLGWVGAGYVLCRTAAKTVGGILGVRWAGAGDRVSPQVGTALFCQAAVVIGLAGFVSRNWQSELAGQFATIVLGSVVIFELAGPLLVRRCVKRSGEVKAITLLGRNRPAIGGASVVSLTLQSLGRFVGLPRRSGASASEQMQVRHIMRRNVQCLRTSDNLDAVLHFIERSTYNHFPVIDEGGRFAGMIHFSDVRSVIYEPAFADLVTAIDLADQASPLVPMDLPLRELLDVFRDQNVGVLAVAEGGEPPGADRVAGLVEQRDLLRVLQPSSRRE